MIKRGISLLLILTLLLSIPVSVHAQDSVISADEIIVVDPLPIQPRYSYTNSLKTTLNISGSTATCKASLTGITGTTTKIVVKMTLQKKTLLWWSEVETWSATYNTYYGTLSKSTSIGSGAYRVKAVYTVYGGSNSESITDYSSQIKV